MFICDIHDSLLWCHPILLRTRQPQHIQLLFNSWIQSVIFQVSNPDAQAVAVIELSDKFGLEFAQDLCRDTFAALVHSRNFGIEVVDI